MLSPLFYALGYLIGMAAFAYLAYRRRLLTVGVGAIAFVGLIGGLVGANVVQFLVSGQPGKTLLGGLAFGYLSVALCQRALGITRPLGDLFAFGLSAGEAVGRLGCYFGGCCYGRPVEGTTSVLLAVHQHDALRYPTQLYLALAGAITFGLLLLAERRGRLPENGLFLLYGILTCAFRFAIEFYRTASPVALGLTLAQWTCLVGVALFSWKFLIALPQTGRVGESVAT